MNSFFVHHTSIVDDFCKIGNNTKIWHFSHIMQGATIGENCSIGQNVLISTGAIIGNNVRIQNNVSVYQGVICEDDVFIGPSAVFTNVINPRSAISRKHEYLQTLVKKGASIGANATIVCGNTLGEYCFIGAGSVVTKDVPPYALIVGNPGRRKGWMSEFGIKLEFDDQGMATCTESGEQYVFKQNRVKKIKL
jgi:UDP-2-acetamido-3-amino-2,3-dideoxy-glucuronate N-acetyltransferase